ncbi:MAG: energy transducer TonB [Acidobacteriaceae bacterium]
MAKPLHSDDPNPPSVQFRDFGVLDDGKRSKGAAAASIAINVTLLALVVILGLIIKTNPTVAKEVATLTLPPPPPPPPATKPPPPPKIKPLPPTPVPAPKIKMPEPKPIPPPPDVKPLPTPQPKPNFQPPAPPKRVNPPPAPVKVNLGVASAASVPNHDLHPSAVRLGQSSNPLKPLNGPAVASVNLGNAGMPGMNRANTGNGPRASSVNLGSGSPNGRMNGRDNAAGPVRGVSLGSGNGPMSSRNYAAVKPVGLGTPPPPPAERSSMASSLSAATPPKITFKPEPVYTEDAKSHHIEGDAVVKVIFRANDTIDVIGLVRGLGYGLDEPALQVARGIRFRPARNAAGDPVDFPTNVVIRFVINN